jgi:AsmA family protein
VPALELEQPDLKLQRIADGRNNWTLQPGSSDPWEVKLEGLRFDHGTVRIVDAIRQADLKADLAGLEGRDGQAGGKDKRISWKVSGTFHGVPISGSGRTGGILALQQDTGSSLARPFPVTAELTVGKTYLGVDGTMTLPRERAALDMRLKLSGANLTQLYPITGLPLPETSAFALEGRLTASLNQDGASWKYDQFKGKVGASDFAGTLEYRPQHPRPKLTGEVVSHMLRLEDLAPLIGIDSKASKARRGFYAVQSADKILPVQAFRTEGWTGIDADVRFIGQKFARGQAMPIDNLTADLKLEDGVLSLAPLDIAMAGGSLGSTIRLDGRARTIKAEITVSARHLKLSQLFPKFPPMKASRGEINGDASLAATGNSIAALLGSANGDIKALINQGTVNKRLLNQIGLNTAGTVLTELFGDQPVKINCLAIDFQAADGLMQSRAFVADTEQSMLFVDGRIDFVNERMNLMVDPRGRNPGLFSWRSPLHVNGSFKAARVDADASMPAYRTGAGTLDRLMPMAATLLPLINPLGEHDSGCNNLLPVVKPEPLSPPPGQLYPAGHQNQVFITR